MSLTFKLLSLVIRTAAKPMGVSNTAYLEVVGRSLMINVDYRIT